MTGLLSNERVCPTCHGDKRVEVSEHRYSTTAETPYTYEANCDRCDGVGVIAVDRRECRVTSGTVADAFTALRNALALKHAELVVSEDHVNALLLENRRLREAVHKAAVTIERTHERLRVEHGFDEC